MSKKWSYVRERLEMLRDAVVQLADVAEIDGLFEEAIVGIEDHVRDIELEHVYPGYDTREELAADAVCQYWMDVRDDSEDLTDRARSDKELSEKYSGDQFGWRDDGSFYAWNDSEGWTYVYTTEGWQPEEGKDGDET